MKNNEDYKWKLTRLLGIVSRDGNLLYKFLQDLLSPYEFTDLATRWQIVKQLDRRVSHRRIAKNLHISVATVNRGALMLKNKTGGFKQVLNKYAR